MDYPLFERQPRRFGRIYERYLSSIWRREAAALPYANKIWMLFGFELFAGLRKELAAEVLESSVKYPEAIDWQ